MMTHFKNLLERNQQIRCGGKENFGTTMLFGSLDNIKSESYMRKLYQGIISDIATLIINKIRLGMDSFGGVVITNTANTLDHDENVPDLITNRKQEVRLFLMDFYQKQLMFQHGDLVITNKRFNPKIGEISRTADFYLRMSLYALCSAVTEYERAKLSQDGIDNLYHVYDETYKKIENSLLEEICERVVNEIKAQKLSRFDRASALQRSVSSHSFFYQQQEEEESELTFESVHEMMKNPQSDFEFRRNSMGCSN
jgi:hypothetical protein